MSLRSAYHALLAAREITPDPAQEQVINKLAQLAECLAPLPKRWLPFGKKAPPPRGLYIYGEVGRGKSMVMDLFFNTVKVTKKRRVHFHAFMLEVHAALHSWRQEHNSNTRRNPDPIPPLARKIASECRLLCFDEFQVTDIADAMLLGRLFKALFAEKLVVVATSNRRPDDLYKDGLQRERFLDFIALLKQEVEVVELAASQDYRLAQLHSLKTLYMTPINAESDRFLDEAFTHLTLHAPVEPVTLTVQGRTLTIPKACGSIAFLSFAELCEKPLGAADYIALSERFSTLLLAGIPTLSPEKRNEAKRFVTLIDALYEHHVKLLCSAEAAPQALYPEGTGAFEFQRTVSRLMEMQSDRYMAMPHLSFTSA